MNPTRRKAIASGLAAASLSMFGKNGPAEAAPLPYNIQPGQADITFIFTLNGARQTGTAPLATADLRIDPQALQNSSATVTADLVRARTGFVFATQAMKAPNMLDTRQFPKARFRSTLVRLGPGGRLSEGAEIRGDLTLRGVTRPVRFEAGLFRPPGSAPDQLDVLEVRLTGRIKREDFGINGYPDLVAPVIGLDIRAKILRA